MRAICDGVLESYPNILMPVETQWYVNPADISRDPIGLDRMKWCDMIYILHIPCNISGIQDKYWVYRYLDVGWTFVFFL
jgi:hypothetical protein